MIWPAKHMGTNDGKFEVIPFIGFLTVDFDDESVAQMQFLKKLMDMYTSNTVMENISEMWFTYMYGFSTNEGQCQPTFRLFDKEVSCLINAYPKEWLINEISRDELLKYDFEEVRSFEPWWKLILGNKAILPLLWSEFPNHPNLLPAYFDDPLELLSSDLTGDVEKSKEEI